MRMSLEKRSEASWVESSAWEAVHIFGTLSQGRWPRRPSRRVWGLVPFSISFLLWRSGQKESAIRSECHWRKDQMRGLGWNHLHGRLYAYLAHSRREDGRVDLVEELGAYFRFQFHFCCGVLQRYSHTFGQVFRNFCSGEYKRLLYYMIVRRQLTTIF